MHSRVCFISCSQNTFLTMYFRRHSPRVARPRFVSDASRRLSREVSARNDQSGQYRKSILHVMRIAMDGSITEPLRSQFRIAVGQRMTVSQTPLPLQRSCIEIASTNCKRTELLRDERRARDLVKRIRKLRWMGMEEEAKQLQCELSRVPSGDTVLLLPANTD
jgi:hypothetical protein